MQKQPVLPATSFDVFSMAGVISQILLGENLVYRWSKLRIPGDSRTFYVDWVGFYRIIDDSEKFKSVVLKCASKTNNGSKGINPRQPILEKMISKYPKFLDNWREMWGQNGQIRTEGLEKMWQLFLHGV